MSSNGTEHRVRDPAFNGRVREFVKEGARTDVDMVAVEEFETAKHGSISGGPPVEVQHARKRMEIREKHAYGVMIALADYLGYEVTPK